MTWFQAIITVVSFVVQRSAQKKAAQKAKQQEEERQRQADLLAAQSRGVMLNAEANDSPLPLVFGRRRVGGVTCLKETTGPSNQFLYKIVALCEGPIESIVNVYYDNVLSTDTRFASVAAYESYFGTETQAASTTLIAALGGKWTTAHQGKGVAYVLGGFTWSDTAWQGEPTITADVHGRLLYDPRDAGTRFSNNPALAIRDYLTNARYGRGIAESAIDDDSFIAAANFCDEQVAVPTSTETVDIVAAADAVVFTAPPIFGFGDGVEFSGAAPGGLSLATQYYYIPVSDLVGKLATSYANALAGTAAAISSGDGTKFILVHNFQVRHQLDGVVDVEQTPLDNVGLLMTACRGYLIYSAGLYKLKCDQAEAASGFEFTEDNIVGAWKIQLASRRERLNRVTARFFNPARQWQPDFAVFDSTTYRTADNELVLETEVSLPYTANVYRALRHAQLECRQSRLGIQVRFRATVDALRCEVGDVVAITHSTPGWTDKLFRIDAMELRPDDEVDVFATEYDEGAYDLDADTAVRTAPVTNLPSPFGAAAPGTPAVTEELYETRDGRGVAVKAVVTWVASADAFVNTYQPEFKLSADSAWTVLPLQTAAAVEILDIAAGVYDFRVKAFNTLGIASAYSATTTQEIVGLGAAPAALTNLTIQKIGSQAFITFTQSGDLDVKRGGRILVRHSEASSGATWESSFSIGNERGYPGDAVYVLIPLKGGTYLLKAEDSTGQQSASASVVSDGATALEYSTVGSVTEDTSFPGTHSNTVAVDGILKLAGAGLFDDIADLDSISSLDDYGGVLSTGTYTFSAGVDLGSKIRVQAYSEIEGVTVNVNDKIDDRAGDIDDWLDFDGTAGGGSTDAWTEIRSSDDAVAWSAWNRLDVSEQYARYLQFRLQMRSTDTAYNLQVSRLRCFAQEIV